MGEEKGEWSFHSPFLHTFSASNPFLHPNLLSLPSPSCTSYSTGPPHLVASLTGPPFPSCTDPRMAWTLLGAGTRLGLEEGCPYPPCQWGWGTPPLSSTAHSSSWEMGALPYWGKECA